MIEEQVKIHDKFSIEIKLGFLARNTEINEFSVNMWIFLPNSLDVNRWNYTKPDFYRDLKSNIRLVTPIYLLRDISDKNREPFTLLEKAFKLLDTNPSKEHKAKFEYHIKMFVSIIKSALRDEVSFIINNFDTSRHYLVSEYIESINKITTNYRVLGNLFTRPSIKAEVMNFYLFGDEFMSNLIEQHTFKLMEGLKQSNNSTPEIRNELMSVVNSEINYKKEQSYPYVDRNSPDRNRDLISRLGLLKKYAENELFLNVYKQREGVIIEHVYLSIAAGISMIFATAVAFSFQQQYGNLTMPFFVALVVSYILKDRIKELVRYYLAHRVGRGFFDLKTRINLSEHDIGWNKEGMDFISEKKVPTEVLRIRSRSAILEAENRINKEQIVLYRKLVRLNRKNLDKVSPYPVAGMNDIIRFNVSNYIQKMDNPIVPLYVASENGEPEIIKGEKVYYINLIMQFKNNDGARFKRYRIIMNRKGISEIESF